MRAAGSNPLKVLMVSAEVAPFAKAGGLADVAGGLPKALKTLGIDIRVVMPAYKMVVENPLYEVSDPIDTFPVVVRPGVVHIVTVRQTFIHQPNCAEADVPVYLIGETRPADPGNAYFEHAVSSSMIYAMEPDPYVFFDHAVVEWVSRIQSVWHPDILHSNDWHTGLIPLLSHLHAMRGPEPFRCMHLFTIHNLAYQGEFSRDLWYTTGLDDSYYTLDGLECYGQWSFMKAALNFADEITTVSPRYAREIRTPEYGAALDGLLQRLYHEGRLEGILNGIDTDVFNPATDPNIAQTYSADAPEGKSVCKQALQRELGLTEDTDAVVIGMVSRFAEQKGLDLFHAVADKMLESNVQFALLGAGDPRFEHFLQELSHRLPGRVAVRIEYNAPLAQRIYAGSDIFLMPSRFEPCGLGQLIALRYGAIPLVRSSGGLADTIVDYDKDPEAGNGFSFEAYSGDALVSTLRRAVDALKRPKVHKQLVHRALSQDWSWERSAHTYIELFEELVRRQCAGNESSADPV